MLVLFLGWKLAHRIRAPDLRRIDLHHEEHEDGADDLKDDEERETRTTGKLRWAWKAWYLLA